MNSILLNLAKVPRGADISQYKSEIDAARDALTAIAEGSVHRVAEKFGIDAVVVSVSFPPRYTLHDVYDRVLIKMRYKSREINATVLVHMFDNTFDAEKFGNMCDHAVRIALKRSLS